MSKLTALSEEQRLLVAQHTKIVEWEIYNNITVNEHTPGLGYQDLYQEGCLSLCEAAATYNGSTTFETYAQVVVHNKMMSYLRKLCRQPKTLSLQYKVPGSPYSDDGDKTTFMDLLMVPSETESGMSLEQALAILAEVKPSYSGVALKGIEAIELKLKGYSGTEIAEMYGVRPNHVGAWISRAAQKLRRNSRFMRSLSGYTQC